MNVSHSRRLLRRLRSGGLAWLLGALRDRVAPVRPAMLADLLAITRDCAGLEIGGPSRIFGSRGSLPVYRQAARIDNVNFSARTAWEMDLRDGGTFRFNAHRGIGTQWIREAVELTGLPDAHYEFVLSSHCLEHVANPLAALHEWRRVTRPGGHLILVLPNHSQTFDRRRPVTTLDHLRADLAHGTGEDDLSHAAEATALHDIAQDSGIGSRDDFSNRVQANATNRCLHHHVFDLPLMTAMLAESGWRPLSAEALQPVHLLALARKDPK